MHDASRGGEIFVVIKLENGGGDLVNREEGFEGECYRLVFNFGRSVRICSGSNDSVRISLGKVEELGVADVVTHSGLYFLGCSVTWRRLEKPEIGKENSSCVLDFIQTS
ncbi:hypothetical protein Droror1_Dr00012058 [Drosera rotundifolia]